VCDNRDDTLHYHQCCYFHTNSMQYMFVICLASILSGHTNVSVSLSMHAQKLRVSSISNFDSSFLHGVQAHVVCCAIA